MERNLPAPFLPAPTAVGVTAVAATDLITATNPHGCSAGDTVQFASMTGGAGLAVLTNYFVIATGLNTTQLKVSATSGGAAIDITTDMTAGLMTKVNAVTNITAVGDLATTPNNHGLNAGDSVTFGALVGGTGLVAGTVYYVIATGLTATAFKVAATFGGSAVDITVDYTSAFWTRVLNWNNCKAMFTLEQRGWLAKYFESSAQGALADGSIVDNNVLRNFYQTATLP